MRKRGKLLAKFRRTLLLIWLVLSVVQLSNAERLPIKIYTSADGLASGAIFHVARDSRGFLWFSTRDGLSRFDGREFVNFRLEGNNSPVFNSTLETRDGWFWIAASGGLYRVKINSAGKIGAETVSEKANGFQIFKAEHVSDISTSPPLFEDSRGRLWGGGSDPLLIAENGELRMQKFDLGAVATKSGRAASVFHETPDGSVWFGCDPGALRLLPDGRRILYPIERRTTYDEMRSITADEEGRIWIGHSSGVFVVKPESLEELADAPDLSFRSFSLEEKNVDSSVSLALPNETGKMLRLMFDEAGAESSDASRQTWKIDRIFKSSDGKIWVPASGSLFVFDKENVREFHDTNGFPGAITSIGEDIENNIWITTESGALKFNRRGMTTWGQADGLFDPRVHSLFQTKEGELFIVHGDWRISRITENGIESSQLNLPDGVRFLWTSTAALLDSSRNWWAVSSGGLYRFAGAENFKSLSQQKPERVFGQKDGFKSNSFYTAFEDSGGNIWVSTRNNPEESGFARLDSETKEWKFFTTADGFPDGAAVKSFAEDKTGNIWVGFYGGGFLRYNNERFTDFSNAENVPKGAIFALHVDLKGRLWIGSTRDGLSLVENPSAEQLKFIRYTTEQGLATNNVRSLTSDLDGNIYIGTIRGVDRLQPETGSVRHYSTADGLASDSVPTAFRDRFGHIWFGTLNGLSRLEPNGEISAHPLPLRVSINSLEIAGMSYDISEFGQEKIENIAVGASDDNLRINFLSVGDGLRYQYKLESGEGEQAWSNPTTERTVNFANLAPGSYNFLVRAIDSSGRASENPALVSFTIRPPFWQSWWFLLLAGVAISGLFITIERYRAARAREVETALAISRESEERFRTLAETASDAILTIDKDSRILFANAAIEKIFGYRANEIIGEKLTILMPEKMRPMHEAGLNRYLTIKRREIAWTGVELPGMHKSGREIPLEVSFGEFERDGKHYFTGIIRDISERRRAEEALRKAREERFKELQRVRTRIATDLHDDIGSSLTQIAVLSEVARSQAILETVKTPLERISDVSNELVDAMADIVWAINPKKDNLRELILRMRRFASDVLSAREIDFELEAPETDDKIQVGANIRREVFAIYKECVNNIVRHAGATEVKIEFEIIVGVLRLKIADNGHGFDAAKVLDDNFSPDKGGNGLVNIRRRVSDLNGSCEINSSSAGTVIALYIPLQKEQEEISLTIRVDSDQSNGNGLH